ncbi:MAG TPA: ATP-binding protein, partial [Flavobacterium sp.]|uniref:ATP-binding response regulator n=1 Tax=Flavobacterium sp. TaxID=239 RepID=UPI002ED468FC
MEFKLRKLELQDFTKSPNDLGSYQRNVLQKYVDYLNQNIPDDSTNTLSKQASDSILANSKKLLSDVKQKAEKKKESLNFEENKLLKNEIAISEQLRKVLRIIEREIIINSIKNNSLKEKSLKKVNEIVTASAIIGLLLTVVFSIIIVSDYSKSQLYKKQLEIANFKTKNLLKSREQLISTVSHDLKTPLSTIVGYSELLGNSDVNTKQSYFIKNIKNSSEYITQLVQDLLDFSQIEAGKITIEKVPFLLPEIIDEVAKNIQTVYKQKNIDLIINADEKLNTKIVGDPFRLKQILSNIIGNAYKFTEEGFIKISAYVTEDNDFFTITIEDSGIGIEKENQKLVFEEFAQANENIEKKYGGTGLGLAICQKIISILGGKLNLKSTFGEGSTFEITLPLLFDSSISLKETKSEEIIPISKNLTFIVVDDDINLLNLTSTVLKQQNHQVFSFTHATKALESIQNTDFDFIITDIQMPEVDGFLFVEKLKQETNSFYKGQPIIAITGRTDLDFYVYSKAGFSTVIKKPYSPKILLETIQRVLDNDILSDKIVKTKKELSSKSYSLTSLKEFLGNDNDASKEFIESFMESTKLNLIALRTAVQEKNIPEINSIAHRIAPMFRQIQADKIGEILKTLEQNNLENSDLENLYNDLKIKIDLLFETLKKEKF